MRRSLVKLTASLAACAAIGSVLAAWAFWIEPSRLVFRETDLEIERLPTGLAGLEIALLADLHIGAPHVGAAT
jgi:predicted MPP superfamily phosphohydrolase